ncbi:hypothetical protein BDN67DRAFT_1016621 [Paxillus ammoniavirescens]|nr:hypothetical protein BDN67DRAFT_1016621 [Paxillus ammoniavirescens]
MQDSQYHHLQECYESLELQVVGLTAGRDALKAICQQFSGPSQPHHGHSHIDMPIDPLLLSLPQDDMKQPTPETHPNIKFWKQADWVKWSERAEYQLKASCSIIPYLEDEKGGAIGASDVKAI